MCGIAGIVTRGSALQFEGGVTPMASAIVLASAFLLFLSLTYGGIAASQNFILNAYLLLLVGILYRLPGLAASGCPPAPSEGVPRVHA